MAGHGQRSEGAQVSTVSQGQETAGAQRAVVRDLTGRSPEGYDDKQDGLLVDMPSKQKGCVAACRDGTYKGLPRRLREDLDQRRLYYSASAMGLRRQRTLTS